jgi:hypothetical protein
LSFYLSHKFFYYDQPQASVLHEHNRHFFCRNALFFHLIQIFIDSLEGEINGIFALVVHANTHENLYLRCRVVARIAFVLVHLFELPDESILDVEFPQIAAFWALLIEDFADVCGLDLASVGAHWNGAVINTLLEDPR